RATIESAGVGLGTADVQGRFVQVTERLCAILGRGRDDLMDASLIDIAAGEDRTAIASALAMLQNGDVTRWEGEINGTLGVVVARLPNTVAAEPILLVQ